VALLAVHVLRGAGAGDEVANGIVGDAAADLAAHVAALRERLAPWARPPAVVLHGGLATDPIFRPHLVAAVEAAGEPPRIIESAADAVTGALEYARRAVAEASSYA
jgi:N-acetylglucosamine kinase-like BadF-type ATPase